MMPAEGIGVMSVARVATGGAVMPAEGIGVIPVPGKALPVNDRTISAVSSGAPSTKKADKCQQADDYVEVSKAPAADVSPKLMYDLSQEESDGSYRADEKSEADNPMVKSRADSFATSDRGLKSCALEKTNCNV